MPLNIQMVSVKLSSNLFLFTCMLVISLKLTKDAGLFFFLLPTQKCKCESIFICINLISLCVCECKYTFLNNFVILFMYIMVFMFMY